MGFLASLVRADTPYLILEVDRDNIVEDTLRGIQVCTFVEHVVVLGSMNVYVVVLLGTICKHPRTNMFARACSHTRAHACARTYTRSHLHTIN